MIELDTGILSLIGNIIIDVLMFIIITFSGFCAGVVITAHLFFGSNTILWICCVIGIMFAWSIVALNQGWIIFT